MTTYETPYTHPDDGTVLVPLADDIALITVGSDLLVSYRTENHDTKLVFAAIDGSGNPLAVLAQLKAPTNPTIIAATLAQVCDTARMLFPQHLLTPVP